MKRFLQTISMKFLLMTGIIGVFISKAFAQEQDMQNMGIVYGVPNMTSDTPRFTFKNILLYIGAPIIIIIAIIIGIRVFIQRKRKHAKKNSERR